MKLLQDFGSLVSFHDPFFEDFPKMRKFSFLGKSIKLNDIQRFDFEDY